jgi:protoporphyrinogen oxidase
LVLEFFCDVGDEIWAMSNQALCELAERELVQLHLLEPGDVADAFVVRSRDAYPRYHLHYRAAVKTITDSLEELRNLCIVGRGGTFRYSNADRAIETGLQAARRLLGDAGDDADFTGGERGYLEERRVQPGRAAS